MFIIEQFECSNETEFLLLKVANKVTVAKLPDDFQVKDVRIINQEIIELMSENGMTLSY